MSKLKLFFGGLLFGSLAGAALGILAAPRTGRQTRHQLADLSDDIYRKAAYEFEELSEKIDDVRHRMHDLKKKAHFAYEIAPTTWRRQSWRGRAL